MEIPREPVHLAQQAVLPNLIPYAAGKLDVRVAVAALLPQWSTAPCPVLLPEDFHAHLSDAWGPGAADNPHVGAGIIAVRIVELRVIEGVEELRAELHAHAFEQFRLFLKAKVPVVESWAMEEAAIGIAKRSQYFAAKGSFVKVSVRFPVRAHTPRVANAEPPEPIRPIDAGGTGKGVIATFPEAGGETGGEARDAIDAPPLRQARAIRHSASEFNWLITVC